MCGRYTLTTPKEILKEAFDLSDMHSLVELKGPRFNIAPTQNVAVIANRPKEKGRQVEFFRWGLVPSWMNGAKDLKIGASLINARAETVAEKPSFRAAYKKRRCLVLADAFYEWKKAPEAEGGKIPTLIRMKSREPFAFAGLWETWHAPADSASGALLHSCTILTTSPNRLLEKIHDRMPVILPRAQYARWLDPEERKDDELRDLIASYPAAEMETYSVSKLVNSPRNDVPECMNPA
jgi:putative SOS response-associated peptidase YedK